MAGVIAVLAIIAGIWVILKFRDDKTFITIIVILVGAFLLTSTYVIKTGNIDIKSGGGIIKFTGAYFSWLGQAFGNVKSVTGSVVDADWRVKSNSTTQNNETIK